jgi:hypothetical protein
MSKKIIVDRLRSGSSGTLHAWRCVRLEAGELIDFASPVTGHTIKPPGTLLRGQHKKAGKRISRRLRTGNGIFWRNGERIWGKRRDIPGAFLIAPALSPNEVASCESRHTPASIGLSANRMTIEPDSGPASESPKKLSAAALAPSPASGESAPLSESRQKRFIPWNYRSATSVMPARETALPP